MEVFWKTIAGYNASTWTWQVALILAGMILTAALIMRPTAWMKILMKAYLILLYLWIAVVYYFIYCSERKFSNVLMVFWLLMAAIWAVDLARSYTTFERSRRYDWFAYLMLVMPFLYPAVSLLRGLSFPSMTTPVMPGSVAVFSIGLMLLFDRKVNMYLVLFLLHWSVMAMLKTRAFGIPEDFLLASVSAPALYLFFRGYYSENLHQKTKPESGYILLLLLLTCAMIAVSLTLTAVFPGAVQHLNF